MEQVPVKDYELPIGKADVLREGEKKNPKNCLLLGYLPFRLKYISVKIPGQPFCTLASAALSSALNKIPTFGPEKVPLHNFGQISVERGAFFGGKKGGKLTVAAHPFPQQDSSPLVTKVQTASKRKYFGAG